MKAKLIKTEVNYLLENQEGVIIASTSVKKEGLALSLNNCQSIEKEYEDFLSWDMDVEVVMEYYNPLPPTRRSELRPKLDVDGCLILKRV
jgi:hypothetical protein